GVGIYDEGIGWLLADSACTKLGLKKSAVLYNSEDAFMQLVKDSFSQKSKELGCEIVLEEAYTYETKDFRTLLLKAKERGADALLVAGYDEAGLVLRQAGELGLNFTIFGTETFTSKNFLANAGDSVEGAYFTSWNSDSREYKDFLVEFQKKYSALPEQPLFSATGYDSVMVLVEAMKQGATSGESLKKALLLVNNLDGITGTLTMSPDGIVRVVKEEMFRIEGASVVKVNK
ncbi:MAG: ABC transporter substrate-binding protein, partial [Candidatus Woesearchaeota archaeon]|nr:ABC transporter substrate-binding protein [Candidatus Woesearchaeota archaeon]